MTEQALDDWEVYDEPKPVERRAVFIRRTFPDGNEDLVPANDVARRLARGKRSMVQKDGFENDRQRKAAEADFIITGTRKPQTIAALKAQKTETVSVNEGVTVSINGVPYSLAKKTETDVPASVAVLLREWIRIHVESGPVFHRGRLDGSARLLIIGQDPATHEAVTAVTYITVYEFTTYQGAYMHMSQDYSILALIGWSDRISSFVVKNSQSGVFWTDWLYSGTRYSFCCNQSLGSLWGASTTPSVQCSATDRVSTALRRREATPLLLGASSGPLDRRAFRASRLGRRAPHRPLATRRR